MRIKRYLVSMAITSSILMQATVAPIAVYASVSEITITSQPTNQTVVMGGTANFSIECESADGSTLSYQWQ